ncbi:SMI1/KNR4 family protein [Solibacillus sp. FSL K6-1523]|uniref:SMI1/KNR4 family protein n=1 Tax=Solibacillus sp. FSL K6-1523 TaxID=2921471 RepID=UPI0030F75B05
MINEDLIGRIESFLNKIEFGGFRGKPATNEEILNAEQVLNVKFNVEYIQFIKLFGGACAGFDIHAFNNGSSLGKETVVELTQRFRRGGEDLIPQELKDAYVISDDGSGNPILMNAEGKIFIFLHDSWEVELLYNSLQEMLMNYFPQSGGYYV